MPSLKSISFVVWILGWGGGGEGGGKFTPLMLKRNHGDKIKIEVKSMFVEKLRVYILDFME